MRDFADPLSLNKTTNYHDYNCYGFAFGTLDWEEPSHFDNDFSDNEDRIDACVGDILKEHPDWHVIESYNDAHPGATVVGFRIGIAKEPVYAWNADRTEYGETGEMEECHADFHFIVRHHGKWFEKPGSWEIQEIDYDIDEDWPHHDRPYNSRITWFTKAT